MARLERMPEIDERVPAAMNDRLWRMWERYDGLASRTEDLVSPTLLEEELRGSGDDWVVDDIVERRALVWRAMDAGDAAISALVDSYRGWVAACEVVVRGLESEGEIVDGPSLDAEFDEMTEDVRLAALRLLEAGESERALAALGSIGGLVEAEAARASTARRIESWDELDDLVLLSADAALVDALAAERAAWHLRCDEVAAELVLWERALAADDE